MMCLVVTQCLREYPLPVCGNIRRGLEDVLLGGVYREIMRVFC